MPSSTPALENKLDRDFLRYLSLVKPLFDNVASRDDQTLCMAWLKRLCGKCLTTARDKSYRNIYFSRLLLQMQDGKLKDVFSSSPPPGELENPYVVFGMPDSVDDLRGFNDMGFQLDKDTVGSGDLSEISRDGRTYLATREIKNGMMAYLAVTLTEDEPLWLPQQARPEKGADMEIQREYKPIGGGHFIKRLKEYECAPLSQLRKSPEERENVLEWMDRIIDGCNRWLRGEDPHNSDLEVLFELLYQDYEEDPERKELLAHPKDVRDVLMTEIRNIITKRRDEVTRRELILDQYEADEYVEEKYPCVDLNPIWNQCAKRPLKDSIKKTLEEIYPCDVVRRFFNLLVQERILIIERGERDINRKIAAMKSDNVEDMKRELQRVMKLKQDYKEYYSIYKEAEEWINEQRSMLKESGMQRSGDKLHDKKDDMETVKGKIEEEINSYRRRYEAEREAQGQLVEELVKAKECFCARRDELRCEEERLKCQKDLLMKEQQNLKGIIESQKRRLCELKSQVKQKQQKSGINC